MTGAVTLDIAEVVGSFPNFRVALVVVDGLAVSEQRPQALTAFIEAAERGVVAELQGVELADIAELQAWREAYRAFGVKKTSYRSSIERLLKNLQRGGGLPHVNALVDAYNAVSALDRMPIGADDLDRVTLPLAFRYARPSDSFIALGDAAATPDPPKEGEVVYADAEKCLCRRWNWYQDARSAISLQTTGAVLTVQSLADDDGRLRDAARYLVRLIAAHNGGRGDWGVADARNPSVTVTLN